MTCVKERPPAKRQPFPAVRLGCKSHALTSKSDPFLAPEISISVKLSAEKPVVFELSRLIRNLGGEIRVNDWEQVVLSQAELENLLGVFYEPLLASIPAKLRNRCIFNRLENPVDMDLIIPAVLKPLSDWLQGLGRTLWFAFIAFLKNI